MDKFSLEKVKKSGMSLGSLFSKKFLEDIKSLNLQPINITFVKHTDEMRSKNITPQILIVSHENDQEVKESLAHISCLDEELLKKFMGKL
ncbi:MAG: hypothetical protein ABIH25_02490 [Candidatus Woesearchaeota archaeon]